MKRVLISIMCLLVAMAALASCDMGGGESHIHTVADTISKDAVGHWYEFTCECEDLEVTKLDHVDKNNDKMCDICEYTNHTHEYSEDWTVDCTNHWHAADCGCTVTGTDVAKHVDEISDGVCDECGYLIEDLHTHIFGDEWVSDGEYHWHAPLCEHSGEVSDKEAHNVDGAGNCTVCKASVSTVNEEDLDELFDAIAANSYMVNKLQVNHTININDGDFVTTQDVHAVRGEDSTYVKYEARNGDYISLYFYWSELLGPEEVFTVGYENEVGLYDGEAPVLTQYTKGVDDMAGYYFVLSTLTDGYGLEDTVISLYELSKTGDELVTNHDVENNKLNMEFYSLVVNEHAISGGSGTTVKCDLFFVSFSIHYNENFVITSAEISVDSYQDGQGAIGDNDFTYNKATGEYTLSETATSDNYHFVVYQQEGERVYKTPYPKSSFTPSDFNYYRDYACTDKINGELNIVKGERTTIYLGDIYPADASLLFFDSDDIQITVVNNDDPTAPVFEPWFNTYNGFLQFTANVTGSYTMTITYGESVDVITVNVAEPSIDSIGAYVFENVMGYDAYVYTVSDSFLRSSIYVTPGDSFDFVIASLPHSASQDFEFTRGAELIETVTLIGPNVFGTTYMDNDETDENEAEFEALRFSSETAGTYVLEFRSKTDPTVTGSLTIFNGTQPEGAIIVDNILTIDPLDDRTTSAYYSAPKTGLYMLEIKNISSALASDLKNGFVEFSYTVNDNTVKVSDPYKLYLQLERDQSVLYSFLTKNANLALSDSQNVHIRITPLDSAPTSHSATITVPSTSTMTGTPENVLIALDGNYTLTLSSIPTDLYITYQINGGTTVKITELTTIIEGLKANDIVTIKANNFFNDSYAGTEIDVTLEKAAE